jgi:hypothetical protein
MEIFPKMNKSDVKSYDDFLVRYRLPRPVSRAYETVHLSKNTEELKHRIQWCARVAVRYLASVWQAHYLQENPGAPVNVPSSADFKLPVDQPLNHSILRKPPVRLLQLAGILSGSVPDKEAALHEALIELKNISCSTLAIVLKDGFLVLAGPRLIYYIYNRNHEDVLNKTNENSVVLYDKETGEFLTMDPLLKWKEEKHSGSGHLMVLKGIEGTTGLYSEDGIPGGPAMEMEINANPIRFSVDLDEKVSIDLSKPPTRFTENSQRGEYHIYGVIWRGGTCDVYLAENKNEKKTLCFKNL